MPNDDRHIGTTSHDDLLEDREAQSPGVFRLPTHPAHSHPEIVMLGMDISRILERIKTSSCAVLIVGETGTGKSVLARMIHESGPQAGGHFVNVHVGGKDRELFNATLFGHKRGAFTGAHEDREGLFDQAKDGTIFLDEIGELAEDCQVKLLQVLDTGIIFPVGSSRPQKTNARVIVATNADLKTAVEKGRMRPDLLHRLDVVISTKPLRERGREALVALANSFATRFGKGKKVLTLESLAWICNREHQWPGNIRQLESLIKLACLLAEGDEITPGDLAIAHAHSVDALLNGSTFTADSHAEPSADSATEPARIDDPSFAIESLSKMTDEQLLAIIKEIEKHGGIHGVLKALFDAVFPRLKELGLNQKSLAEKFGISGRTLYNWRKGLHQGRLS